MIVDAVSERQISARTRDLSVHDCFVLTPTPLNPGVNAGIIIVHAGAKVVAFGRVVSVRAYGMGISLAKIARRDQTVLDRWISEVEGLTCLP